MATNSMKSKEKKPGLFQWLVVIVVSLLFALIMTFIILFATDVNVTKFTKETINKIPFLEDTVTTDKEELHENQLLAKEDTITQLEGQMEELEAEVQTKTDTIEELETTVSSLNEQLNQTSNEEEASEDDNQAFQEMSVTFEEMKPKNAADILANMEQATVIPVLEQLDAEVRAEILSEMEAEMAATYSAELLAQ
ncbi:hypothetical protein MUN88_17740 [Gracilibacillus caseinilyticus]|uniref:Magnesium transporter MgtE intracellular domain-containing protein n=1 Tax=Gracilibacillus caseinilyticus TaxID=2932256 RepID=A0ABY4ETY0_9BACI|nr:hypothetical protein [Gracilibacillus caseinilyticus]UOQ47875.1 hypothetical protein MUN88_17740 [Gracilibacillus caseinilyticus]